MQKAIKSREELIYRAERFILSLFGEDTLKLAYEIADIIKDISLGFARQIATPNLQHYSLFLVTEQQNINLISLQWLGDLMSLHTLFKRAYVVVPFIYRCRKGDLVARNFYFLEGKDLCEVDGERLDCISIPTYKLREFCISHFNRIAPELTSRIWGYCSNSSSKCLKIEEFHALLRREIEGGNQKVIDLTPYFETAAAEALTHGALWIPGIRETQLRISLKGDTRSVPKRVIRRMQLLRMIDESEGVSPQIIRHVSGQFVYIALFILQNLEPNLILAVTDWRRDPFSIRKRYEIAVDFLKSEGGLKEPLQFCLPTLDEEDELAVPVKGMEAKKDLVVPLRRVEPKMKISQLNTKSILKMSKEVLRCI